MACSASTHTCVAAVSMDDPNGRCAGTCDASGACKSKQGQTCNTVAAGCVGGTTCSPDGYCCNTACTGSCVACDLTGLQGTCTNLAAASAPHSNHPACGGSGSCAGACGSGGTCAFPTSVCAGPTCSGTSLVGQSTCNAGSCVAPGAQVCSGALICSASACKTACSADADCLSGYFCDAGTCHLAAIAVAAGISHTCALLSDHTVRCWGDNSDGALGQGYISTTGTETIPTPVAVTLPKGATAIAVGTESSYALLTDGTVWDWGGNTIGQLGNGTFSSPAVGGIPTPAQVTGLPGAVSGIASGTTHACAIVSGVAYCWGSDYNGDLGNGEFVTTGTLGIATPTKVMGLSSAVTSIAGGGDQTCADMGGALMCWGGNGEGEAGTGSTTVGQYDLPQFPNFTVPGPNITAVSASFGGTCVLALGGTVYCVGYNGDGELGNGSFADTSLATFAPIANGPSGAIGATAISAGLAHSCALVQGGRPTAGAKTTTGSWGTAPPTSPLGRTGSPPRAQ
jgi:alpha-tubulin suppressor-like RCC1 family protein